MRLLATLVFVGTLVPVSVIGTTAFGASSIAATNNQVNNCDQLSGYALDGDVMMGAKDKCILESAAKSGDAKLCKQVKGYIRDWCVQRASKVIPDPQNCFEIDPSRFQFNSCIHEMAINKKNAAIFQKIYDEADSSACRKSKNCKKLIEQKLEVFEHGNSPLWESVFIHAKAAHEILLSEAKHSNVIFIPPKGQDISKGENELRMAVGECSRLKWVTNREACWRLAFDIFAGLAEISPENRTIRDPETGCLSTGCSYYTYTPPIITDVDWTRFQNPTDANCAQVRYVESRNGCLHRKGPPTQPSLETLKLQGWISNVTLNMCTDAYDSPIWSACIYGSNFGQWYGGTESPDLKKRILSDSMKKKVFCEAAKTGHALSSWMMNFAVESCERLSGN